MPKSGDPKNRKSEPSKRDVIKARIQNESRKQQLIPLIIVSLAAVALVAIFVLPALSPQGVIGSRPQANGTAAGDPNAPVKVEEFADFQCPACGVFNINAEYEPKIVKDYIATGKVYFKFIPFSFIGDESKAAAEAAYCASDQGKFWEYHDLIFANQRGENQGWFSSGRLLGYASDSKLGLNTNDFKTCFESGKYKQKVLDDIEYGKKNNIDSTPSFLVNGQLVHLEQLIPVIESALKAKGSK
jgi:protein-disulfide isomerase